MKNLKPGQTVEFDPHSLNASNTTALTEQQRRWRRLIDRRHPQYATHREHWSFLERTYNGGREWFVGNVFKYVKEGPSEYEERLERCYRFNHTREVVDLLNKYLFKQHITRNETDAPDSVKRFWLQSTRQGLGIRDFMRQASEKSSVFGRIAIVVDRTNHQHPIISKADEKRADLRTYVYWVDPTRLLDYSRDECGVLNWVLIQEAARDDADPMTSSGEVRARYRLWTKTDWQLFEESGTKRKKEVVLVEKGVHGLQEVPVILHDNIISDAEYVSPSLIDDVAYLDRAVANYLSNLDAIIQDQTYSQLVMPAQNLLPGEESYKKMVEMGTKRVFLYDGENGAAPSYLSPDVKQVDVILTVINKIIGEIYHTVGMAGERTKQDNAVGIDNSSGVAKAYDFERVNALLQAKADSLEVLENKIVRLVTLWAGEEAQLEDGDELVSYPNNFDTRSLYDEFDIAGRLMLVDAPETVRRQQIETLIDKLFPQLAKELRAKMSADLKDWPADPLTLLPSAAPSASALPKAPKDSKQGQNNKQAETTAPGKR